MAPRLDDLYSVLAKNATEVIDLSGTLDGVDRRLIAALADDPRVPVMELARTLGVARGTVQSRLEKLRARGVLGALDLQIDPAAAGYPVLAFCSIAFAQGRRAAIVDHLRSIPEVLEVHTITGESDLHLRVVAHTHEHLQEVLDRILEVRGIDRTTTVIALSEEVSYRTLPLIIGT